MHVITRRRFNEFAREHPDAQSALEHWHRVMKMRRFANFVQLRETFPGADQLATKRCLTSAAISTG
ncbi:MAG TPA: hypothetical protein VL981_11825 [Candidatus Methylacidiphilales bacterium]|nr:hypothetical protein [Candidatus Methylacidiphilales bacterium]